MGSQLLWALVRHSNPNFCTSLTWPSEYGSGRAGGWVPGIGTVHSVEDDPPLHVAQGGKCSHPTREVIRVPGRGVTVPHERCCQPVHSVRLRRDRSERIFHP
eukprot:COSAG01_NODE_4317_length_5137_cov_16.810441_6_plen_102_part_00